MPTFDPALPKRQLRVKQRICYILTAISISPFWLILLPLLIGALEFATSISLLVLAIRSQRVLSEYTAWSVLGLAIVHFLGAIAIMIWDTSESPASMSLLVLHSLFMIWVSRMLFREARSLELTPLKDKVLQK